MIPTWAAVAGAVSLVVIALAALTVAAALVFAALAARRLFHAVQMLAGPAVSDVRHLVGNIRAEADALVGTSRDIRLRIVKAAEAAEDRLADLDALAEVVQEEIEDTALDAAATLRNVRRGIHGFRWARRLLARRRGRAS
jgi:hypothetical protein